MTPLLQRKRTHFVLWRPAIVDPPPKLVIGRFDEDGRPPALAEERTFTLVPSPISDADPPDVWEVDARRCELVEGGVTTTGSRSRIPTSTARPSAGPHRRPSGVRRRLAAARSGGAGRRRRSIARPLSVVRFSEASSRGRSRRHAATFEDEPDAAMSTLPPNHLLVVYELPTAWATRAGRALGGRHVPRRARARRSRP